MDLVPWAAGLDVEVSLALSVSLTLPIDHLFYLPMVLPNVTQVILMIVAVADHGVSVTRHPTEELHLARQSLQLIPELPVLLLELGHGSPQRPAQVDRLLHATFHAKLESVDVHVDFPDGIPQSVLVAGQSCTHCLPLWRGGPGMTQVSHLSQGWSFHHLQLD